MDRNNRRMDAVNTVVLALQQYQHERFSGKEDCQSFSACSARPLHGAAGFSGKGDYQAFSDILETAGKIAMEGMTVKVTVTRCGEAC